MAYIKYGKRSWSDVVGIISAIACMIHCLAAPLLMALGAGFLAYPPLQFLFLAVAFAAICRTIRQGVQRVVGMLLWISFGILVVSILLEESYPILEYSGYLASLGMIIGHIWNIRHCSRCSNQ